MKAVLKFHQDSVHQVRRKIKVIRLAFVSNMYLTGSCHDLHHLRENCAGHAKTQTCPFWREAFPM